MATAEALSATFRRVILDDGASDLETLTYRCAFDACAAHDGAAVGSAQATGAFSETVEPTRTRRRSTANDIGDRFEASLDDLEVRQRAALLLHDVQGLGAAQLAVVFSTSAEAAAALLFRARVEFRGAFHARSAHVRAGACRQAEQTVAGTVGLGLSSGELERLRSHAAYCKPCRKAMQGWRPGAFGLALMLDQAPPPKALAAPPVFGAAGVALAAPPVTGAGWLARTLQPAGHALRSRWAAYVVAAACLALAAGVVLREDTVRRFVLFESVGPAVQLVRAPDAEASRPDLGAAAKVASLQTASRVTSASIGGQTATLAQQAAARPAVPSSPGQPTPTAGPTDAAAPDQVADPDGAAAADSGEDTAGAAGDSERDDSSSSGEKRDKDAAKSGDRSWSDDSGDEADRDKSEEKDKADKDRSGDKDKSGQVRRQGQVRQVRRQGQVRQVRRQGQVRQVRRQGQVPTSPTTRTSPTSRRRGQVQQVRRWGQVQQVRRWRTGPTSPTMGTGPTSPTMGTGPTGPARRMTEASDR